ncbi:hypothetical protein M422DRAFT_272914 [Sphaerobolus stellatus SS14]|uniref:Uncharacterized protein n=1 Tax=Sphaerobolus stellatus (strain SS14) TaxID=990650 RepID=A0A0C9UKQ9_SPHS4|nr:hypothetical protein M422DRAFT_272914 [Sphaerobolus stellatus SS14]
MAMNTQLVVHGHPCHLGLANPNSIFRSYTLDRPRSKILLKWHEITDILYTNPTFIVNTHSNLQFWQSGNEPENYPQPEDWHDILNFWTVNQIQDTFHAPAFLPHKSHWKGLPDGPKLLSFGERFKSFFPTLEADFLTSSVLHILKGIGYLKDYHTFLSTKSEHDILCLQDALKAAFELLECLPDKKTGINSQPWRYHPEKGGPSFILNAKAYKIQGVGPPKKNTNIPHPRAIATHTRIEALLLADNLNISFNDAAKHIKGNNHQAQKEDRCEASHKNKRKPPQEIQSSQGSSANENQEIQPEHLEEDSEEVNGDSIQEQELSGDAPRFPLRTSPSGATPRVNHPQHIRRLLWPESGRFGWRQWSSSGGYMRI